MLKDVYKTFPHRTQSFLHYGKNNLKGKSTPEQVTNNIISMATSVKSVENCVVVSGSTTRTDKHNAKGTKVNEVLQCKHGTTNLPFIENLNNYSNMLNSSGLHLNKRRTTPLVNDFCYALSK